MSAKFDDLEKEIKKKDEKINQLEKTIENLAEKQKLSSEIDDLEQYSRRNCLVLHGVNESNNENTNEIIIKTFSEELGVEIKEDDLDRSHRLGKPKRKDNKLRPIIVKFARYAVRREKNHFSGFIQRRLDLIFISNNIQEYLKKVSILPSFCSDHSPISCILESSSKIQLGKNVWKFNSSLINDEKYVTQMKQHISEVKSQFSPAFENKARIQWEFLKYKIRKFTIEFSKNKAKRKREKLSRLKVKLTELEQNLSNGKVKEQYNAYRGEINEI